MGLGWDIAGPGSGGMGAESNVARTPTLDGVKLGQPELSTKGFQCGLRRGAPFCRFSRVVWNGGVSWIFFTGRGNVEDNSCSYHGRLKFAQKWNQEPERQCP